MLKKSFDASITADDIGPLLGPGDKPGLSKLENSAMQSNGTTDTVSIRNPKGGQTLTVTQKAFESLYRSKGFELVNGSAPAAIEARKTAASETDRISTAQMNGLRPPYGNEPVLARNPKTKQVIETTAKQFHSLYRDKGFELVTRANAEPDGRADLPKSKGRGAKKSEPKSAATGSASDIAKALGLDSAAGAPADQEGNADKDVSRSALEEDDEADDETPPKGDKPAGIKTGENAPLGDELETYPDDTVTEERASHGANRGRNR